MIGYILGSITIYSFGFYGYLYHYINNIFSQNTPLLKYKNKEIKNNLTNRYLQI